MTDQSELRIEPCPFCADAMRVNIDRVEHIVQTRGCPMRDLSLPVERLGDWNTRFEARHMAPAGDADVETRFWRIVDRDGLTGLPSDMWAALETLVNRAALGETK